ncbi:MAG: hypothetical protein IPH28_18755 [Cytophagaceae bacterium]|nr:hypothetical protein [Cytophagaceae bacterium]
MKSLIIFLISIQFALAQTKTDCNTIYICIDSISYEQLFSNAYVRDTLFFCQESTTKTLEEEYTGKYAIGKAANLEFFKPNNIDKIGNRLHDFGIEFKTRSLGLLNNLITTVQNKGIAFDTNTTHLNEEDAKIVWYKTLNLASTKTNYEISILEYQKEFLQYLGFAGDELSQEMSYEEFNTKLSNGKKYPRQFNKIKSVTVTLDKSKLAEYRAFCELNGLRQKNKYSYANDDLEMNFELNKKQNQARIKKISIDLIEAQRNRIIEVSDKINIKVSGQICDILFL